MNDIDDDNSDGDGEKDEPCKAEMYQHGDFKENDIVVGMLEAIEAKLCGLKSDTKAAEATAQKEYASLMTELKVDKANNPASIEHKTAKKQDEEQARTRGTLKAFKKNSRQLSPVSISSAKFRRLLCQL